MTVLHSAPATALILVYTLMEWGGANGVKSHILHRNAEDLNSLQSKIGHLIERLERNSELSVSWQEAEDLRLEYEAIKSLCSENHVPSDDKYFIMTKRHSPEFNYLNLNRLKNFSAWLIWQISSIWYYVCLWIVVVLAVWYGLSKVIPVS